MAQKISSFFRDLIVFILTCIITYKLPGFLLFLLDSKWLFVSLSSVFIGAACSILQSVLSSDHLSGATLNILYPSLSAHRSSR